MKITGVDEEVERLEASNIANENVKWYSYVRQ